jgi:hypothetical protein
VSGQTGEPSLGEGKWQVSKDSKDNGNWPQWRVDSEIVFNTAPSGTAVFAAPVNASGTAFESGVPQRLPLPPNVGVDSTPQSTSDGQRFLVEVSQVQRAARTSISVVLNWPALQGRAQRSRDQERRMFYRIRTPDILLASSTMTSIPTLCPCPRRRAPVRLSEHIPAADDCSELSGFDQFFEKGNVGPMFFTVAPANGLTFPRP